jgi:hypothetical protein
MIVSSLEDPEEESWTDAIYSFSKINPIVFLLLCLISSCYMKVVLTSAFLQQIGLTLLFISHVSMVCLAEYIRIGLDFDSQIRAVTE